MHKRSVNALLLPLQLLLLLFLLILLPLLLQLLTYHKDAKESGVVQGFLIHFLSRWKLHLQDFMTGLRSSKSLQHKTHQILFNPCSARKQPLCLRQEPVRILWRFRGMCGLQLPRTRKTRLASASIVK